MLYCRHDLFDMSHANNNTPVVLYKGNLLSIRNTERSIRDNILIEIIKDSPMVLGRLNPDRFKGKTWFDLRPVVDSISLRSFFKIFSH